MDLVTNPQVRAAALHAFGPALQDTVVSLVHGLVSMAAGYLIVAIGIAAVILVSVIGEVSALVVGAVQARQKVRWVEQRLGLLILVITLVAWVARALGH